MPSWSEDDDMQRQPRKGESTSLDRTGHTDCGPAQSVELSRMEEAGCNVPGLKRPRRQTGSVMAFLRIHDATDSLLQL